MEEDKKDGEKARMPSQIMLKKAKKLMTIWQNDLIY